MPSYSVILSTYNSPALLEKVLWGYERQTRRNFSIVIADDGSTNETRQLIDQFIHSSQLTIHHVWHEDLGFRKTTILNKAIMACDSEYLIFSDGDCIPTPTFVERHQELSRPRRFIAATAIRLSASASTAISEEQIRTGVAFSPRWLASHDQIVNWRLFRLSCGLVTGRILDTLTPTRSSWSGGNASAWRQDILSVNGFNEKMAYGGEDKELGVRLINAGILPIQARHSAQCLHLDHGRDYVDPVKRAANRRIIAEVKKNRLVWTEHGIASGDHGQSARELRAA